ncbi:hypothetical protein KXW02_001099 [Aspergillus fumigatus]|nr:hypothetical protein KXW02_001099 [Aspergillus fumigatus]
MASCSSCYKPTCPGAESCQTLHAISDLVVTYAQLPDPTSPPLDVATSAPTAEIPAEQASVDASHSDSDSDGKINWKNKLAIEATECVFRGVRLSVPPFPFRQRWNEAACHEIGERKNRGRKRKRREYEECDDEEYEYVDNGNFQRMYDTIAAAALATIAAANTTSHPTKRRKKAMKKKQGGGSPGSAGSPA